MIKALFHTQKGNDWIFAFIIIIISVFYSYPKILQQGVLGAHVWRQADCLSITQNYYQHGMNFFEPEIHNQLSDNGLSGKSAGEFPVFYYVNAAIWKICGPNTFTYRLLTLLLTFAGLFSFYRFVNLIFKSKWIAFLLPILLFSSPVYAIYGVSFLTDVPAFSLTLIAWCAIVLYFKKKNEKHLWIAIVLFALAGLIKVSSLIGFIFLTLLFLVEVIGKPTWSGKYLFDRSKKEWIAFAVVPLLILSWYLYADWFNSLHQGKYTFNSIWPFSDLSLADQHAYLGKVRDDLIYVFYSKSLLFLMLFVWISNFFLLKRMPLAVALASLIIPFGVVIYVVLWSGAFINHDYYYVPLLHLFPAIFIPFLMSFDKSLVQRISRPIIVLSLIFTGYNTLYCGSFVFMRHFGERGEFLFAGTSESVFANKWVVKEFNQRWKGFKGIESFLGEEGVGSTDKFICPSDFTINGSLYLMNHKGWTGFQKWETESDIQKKIDLGANWLLIHDFEMEQWQIFNPFMEYPAGDFNNLHLYDLRPYQISGKE